MPNYVIYVNHGVDIYWWVDMARLSFVIPILIIVGILQTWTWRIWVSLGAELGTCVTGRIKIDLWRGVGNSKKLQKVWAVWACGGNASNVRSDCNWKNVPKKQAFSLAFCLCLHIFLHCILYFLYLFFFIHFLYTFEFLFLTRIFYHVVSKTVDAGNICMRVKIGRESMHALVFFLLFNATHWK